MKHMDSKEFDEQIKANVSGFTSPPPPAIWDRIQQELHEEQGNHEPKVILQGLQSPVSKPQKTVRSLKYWMLRYGAVAAMLVIAFAFWNSFQSPVIYLQKRTSVEPIPTQVVEAIPEQVRELPVKNLRSSSRDRRAVQQVAAEKKNDSPVVERYAELKDAKMPIMLESVSENSFSDPGLSVEGIELAAVLKPVHLLDEHPSSLSTADDNTMQEDQDLASLGGPMDSSYPNVGDSKRKKIALSTVLNFLAKGFSNEEVGSIEFSENEEGILRWDVKSGLAKNRER